MNGFKKLLIVSLPADSGDIAEKQKSYFNLRHLRNLRDIFYKSPNCGRSTISSTQAPALNCDAA